MCLGGEDWPKPNPIDYTEAVGIISNIETTTKQLINLSFGSTVADKTLYKD